MTQVANTFNSLNYIVILHNIRHICPALATILINTYRSPSALYVMGDTLASKEGTTQGDPMVMLMYALDTLPLINRLPKILMQVWYADDACACGSVTALCKWYKHFCDLGPRYGYIVNAAKAWLVVKPGTGVNLSSERRPYLGAIIGTRDYTRNYGLMNGLLRFNALLRLLKANPMPPTVP